AGPDNRGTNKVSTSSKPGAVRPCSKVKVVAGLPDAALCDAPGAGLRERNGTGPCVGTGALDELAAGEGLALAVGLGLGPAVGLGEGDGPGRVATFDSNPSCPDREAGYGFAGLATHVKA